MKTRVIQNDAEEPPHDGRATPAGEPRRTNFTGRIGRWSAHHRKTAIFGWFAFVIASFFIGSSVIGAKQATEANGPGESGRAAAILDESFKQPAGETVLIQSDSLQATDPAFVAATRAVVGALVAEDAVINIRSPLDAVNAGQISPDKHSALVDYQIRGDADLAVDQIDPILASIAKVQAAHPQLFVGDFGDASADKELEASFMERPQEGRALLRPAHAGDPDRRLRRPRRGRHPAAARPDGRDGDVRAVGAARAGSGRATSRSTRWCS